jgi:hypothetical protein
MDIQKETEQGAGGGMSRDRQLVHYYDEWEQILPADARAALKPLVEQARAGDPAQQYIPANFTTHRSAWRDAITECINAETERRNHDSAAYWQHELEAFDRSFARLLDHPEVDTKRLALQGMADCMDMVRQELVEAGLIDERVPPMFVSEAVLARLRQLRAAFHVNMVRAYPERTHAEIEAEINRTCWGTAITADEEIIALHRRLAAETLRADRAEARATAKSQECIELRERMAASPAAEARIKKDCDCGCNDPVATTARGMLEFLAGRFEFGGVSHAVAKVYAQDIRKILASLDQEDPPSDGEIYEAVSRRADPAGHAAADAEAQAMLGDWCKECVGQGLKTSPVPPGGDDTCGACGGSGLRKSVTVTEKGPWQVNDWGQGRIVIQSDDFTHDVALEISGDFGSVEREIAYAEEIARRLNGYRVRPYTLAVAAAAEAYYAQFASAHPLPAQWRWPELWHAMDHAAVTDRDLYTCIGKGGTYENLGHARGAGEKRGNIVTVYRDVQTGALYYRDPVDFGERMQRIEDQP